MSGPLTNRGVLGRPGMLPGLLVLFGLFFRRRQAFQALEEFFLGHALDRDLGVVGIDAGAGRADQRHGIGLWLVDLDEFLQGVNQLLAQVFRGNSGIGDFPQRNNRVLVVIPINREL